MISAATRNARRLLFISATMSPSSNFFIMEKRLYRSRTDRMVAGVCGGLGEYFGMDPVIWRLIFLVGLVLGGSTFAIYIIMAIVVPEEAAATKSAANKEADPKEGETKKELKIDVKERNWLVGLVLVVLGAILLMQNFFPGFSWHLVWPFLLIAAGLGMLVNGVTNHR